MFGARAALLGPAPDGVESLCLQRFANRTARKYLHALCRVYVQNRPLLC
jgi:hypothetical protein